MRREPAKFFDESPIGFEKSSVPSMTPHHATHLDSFLARSLCRIELTFLKILVNSFHITNPAASIRPEIAINGE
jgi:hypothetical protein